SHAEVSPLIIRAGQLGMNARALAAAGHLPDDGSAVSFARQGSGERPPGAAEKRCDTGEHRRSAKRSIQELIPSERAGLRVRSWILPASCPHAASISSPRVLRVVVTTPDALSTSLNRSITRRGERTSSPSPGSKRPS